MKDETVDMTRIEEDPVPDPVFPQIRAAAWWRERNLTMYAPPSEGERTTPNPAETTQEWMVNFCETNGRNYDEETVQSVDFAIGGLEDLVQDHEDPDAWIVSFFETTIPRVVVLDPVTETGMTLWVPIITPALELERALNDFDVEIVAEFAAAQMADTIRNGDGFGS